MGSGSRSEKTIPSFLKNGYQSNSRKNHEPYNSKNKEINSFPQQL